MSGHSSRPDSRPQRRAHSSREEAKLTSFFKRAAAALRTFIVISFAFTARFLKDYEMRSLFSRKNVKKGEKSCRRRKLRHAPRRAAVSSGAVERTRPASRKAGGFDHGQRRQKVSRRPAPRTQKPPAGERAETTLPRSGRTQRSRSNPALRPARHGRNSRPIPFPRAPGPCGSRTCPSREAGPASRSRCASASTGARGRGWQSARRCGLWSRLPCR